MQRFTVCVVCAAPIPQRDTSKGGRQPHVCSKECHDVRERKFKKISHHRNYDPAAEADRRRAYYASKPDYWKQFYAKHREQRKREANAYYHANSEQMLEKQKAIVARQRAEHPEHYLALKRKHAATRRARTRDLFVEPIDPRVVFDRAGGTCGICQQPVDPASPWEVDHIVPIVRGGAHSYANVQLAHRRCNRSKFNKLWEAGTGVGS